MIGIDLIKRLLAVFAFPGDPSRASKRALSRLFRSIDRRGPDWYHPWTNRLSPAFLEAVEELRGACARIMAVYKLSIDLAPEAARPILARVVDRLLAAQRLSLKDFNFDSIRAALTTSGKGETPEAVETFFNKRLESFSAEPFRAAVMAYRANVRLAALCAYRWERLIKAFGEKRRGASAEPLKEDLADFYYVAADHQLDEDTKAFYGLLREYACPNYAAKESEADISLIKKQLEALFDDKALGRVVRAVRGEALFELKTFTVDEDFLTPIIDALKADFELKRRSFAEQTARERLEKLKSAIFGDIQMTSTIGYSSSFQIALTKAALPPLDRIEALTLIKSFLAALYHPTLRQAISLAVIDIDYRDLSFRTALSDAADALGFIADSLALLEERAEAAHRSDSFTGLESGILEKSTRLQAERVIRALNDQAAQIVQDTFIHVDTLSKSLRFLLEDLRSRSPELVSDPSFVHVHRIRTVAGIEETERRLRQFQSLLQKLDIDRQAARKAVKDDSPISGGLTAAAART